MQSPKDPFFDHVSSSAASTSAGPCELPILYREASLLTLVYSVDPAAAAAEVDARAFEPWIIAGRAWGMICVFEYRETTIGPYGELGVGVLAKRIGAKPSVFTLLRDSRLVQDAGLYVTSLPVTNDRARTAGIELWGYPKYTTGIATRFEPRSVRVTLEGEMELSIGRGRLLKTSGLPLVTCSVARDGRILRTVVDTDSRITWGGAGSARVKLLGDGPTARTMHALGMDARAPALAFCTDRFRAILPAGVEMGRVAESGARAAHTLEPLRATA
jgi:hypothetical protein